MSSRTSTSGPRLPASRLESVGFIALGVYLARKRTTLSWETWRFQRTPLRRAIVALLLAGLVEHLLRRRP